MEEHYRGDEVVNIENVIEAEGKINNTARVFADILGLGIETGQAKRCKDTLITNMAGIPALQGLRKDHKGDVNGDKARGPPLRPMCGANKSLNAPLGGLIAAVLKGVCDEMGAKTGTEVLSTEEVCRIAEELNTNLKNETVKNFNNIEDTSNNNNRREQPSRKCKRMKANSVLREQSVQRPKVQTSRSRVVGSMDVKALYPSIIKELASEAAMKAVEDTDLVLDNIDVKSLVRFVALKKDRKYVTDRDLGDVVPVPKATTTFNSFAKPRGKAKKSNGDSQFGEVKEKPSEKQVKTLLGIAVAVAVEECMSNHFYTIGGKTYRQVKGGSIGSSLTGETSRTVMLLWDKRFLKKLEELNISLDMYCRYIDDITVVVNVIMKGWTYDITEDKMVFREESEDEIDDDEVRTFNILQSVANSLCPEIQMTVDIPGSHSNNRLPVLDLNLWLSVDTESGTQYLNHAFYKKKVASQYTILKRSAISMSTKRSTHFQEALRRMKNCDLSQKWIERAIHLSEWANMLRISGYGESYRFNILKGAVLRYREIVRKVTDGDIENLYRNRGQVVRDRLKKGGKSSAATWFMVGGVSCTLNTAPTPDGALKEKIQKTLSSMMTVDGGKVKVIETGGVPISIGLKKADPFRVEGCDFGEEGCIVDPKTSCGVMSAVYQLLCSCGDVIEQDSDVSQAASTHNTQLNSPGRGGRARVVGGVRRRVPAGSRTKKSKKKGCKVQDKRYNYLGITGRSLHARQTEHMDAMRRGDTKYALARHMRDVHSQDTPGTPEPRFSMQLVSRHKTNLEKAVTEGVLIEKQDQNYLMNKKGEWGRGRGLIRLTAGRVGG
jgi:hypothetical protein